MDNQNDRPLITVLMAVYNGEQYLERVVNSITDQTFGNWEFVIINDGSSDKTAKMLDKFASQEPRLRVVHQSNMGLTRSLNKGLRLARGVYVARQDADDYSRADRLRVQLEFLQRRPDMDVVGSNSLDHFVDIDRKEFWGWHSDDQIQKVVWRKTPFPHSSVMMVRDRILSLGGYDESLETSQDLELWMRVASTGKLSMIEDVLIDREVHKLSISSNRQLRQWMDGFRARQKNAPGGLAFAVMVLGCQIVFKVVPTQVVFFAKRLVSRD